MENLNNKKWMKIKAFGLGNPLQIATTSSSIDSIRLINGADKEIPYVTRTDTNNGIAQYVSSKNLNFGYDSAECITVGLDTQTAFWQPHDFVTGQNIQVVTGKVLSEEIAQFIIPLLRSQMQAKFNWGGNGATLGRMKALELMLPVTASGKPDYSYMTKYVQIKREELLKKYKAYVQRRIDEIGQYVEIPALADKEWRAFSITELFDRFEPGKGKGLNHLTKASDGINYIGATNRNNGVLCTIQPTPDSQKLIQRGNCIGFIKNGDGSAGYAIYKREDFISTSDVIYGYASWLTPYTGLFFVAAQDRIEEKYNHGYKRNQEHLRGDKVMLPASDVDGPDFEYMEQYAKNMMLRKYKQYLAYLDSKESIK